MPQVVGTGKTRKIVFDAGDWLGGLVPQYGGGADPVVDLGIGKLSNATAFNPFRQLGCAAPGYLPQDPTGYASVGAYLKKGVIDGANIYATSNTDEIHKITIGVTPTVVDDATWPHEITAHAAAASPVADDAVVYEGDQAGTSTRSLFYSWSDDTEWDVGMYNLDATFDDDWMSTAPAVVLTTGTAGVGKPHPLEIGQDDILYMGDRRYIHEYDGGTVTDGTVSEEVLKIPNGMVFKSFAKYTGFLVGFAYRSTTSSGSSYYQGECKAYFWDYLSQDPTYVFDLGDNYVGEAFQYKGTIGVFTQGRTNDLENQGLRSSNLQIFEGFGTGFAPIKTFDTNVPERGGVVVNNEMIHWNSGGHHYTYGNPFIGGDSSMNRIARGASSSTVSGLLMNPSTNFYLQSPTSIAENRLKYYKSGNYTENTIFSTTNSSPNFSEGMMGRIKAVKICMAKTSSGGRTMSLRLIDQAQQVTTIINAEGTFSASTIVKEYKNPADRPMFSTIKPYIQYQTGSGSTSAPIIEKIEVYFEEVNIKNT